MKEEKADCSRIRSITVGRRHRMDFIQNVCGPALWKCHVVGWGKKRHFTAICFLLKGTLIHLLLKLLL